MSIVEGSTRRSSGIPNEVANTVKVNQAANDVIYLKSLVISEQNMDIFIEKLNSTREHRRNMLLDKNVNLKEQFPYFFTNPKTVT